MQSLQVRELLGFADIVGKPPHGSQFFAVLCLRYLCKAERPQITARAWHTPRVPRQGALGIYKYGARSCRVKTSILLTQIVKSVPLFS